MLLSAVVTAKNEADNIERCLKSLQFTNEQIVVDSGSTDNTVVLAKRLGARIVHHPWKSYGSQKNVGLKAAQGMWVLFIDADEEVTPQLASEIARTVQTPTRNFYWLRILTIFLGKPLAHLYGHNPRLFKKEAGEWTNDFVHEQVKAIDGFRIRLNDEHSAILQRPLLHYSHETVMAYLERMHRYTSLDAQQMAQTDHHRSGASVQPTALLPFQLAVKQLLKLLLYRHGFLDGYPGIVWSMLSAYYEWEMGKKYLAARTQSTKDKISSNDHADIKVRH